MEKKSIVQNLLILAASVIILMLYYQLLLFLSGYVSKAVIFGLGAIIYFGILGFYNRIPYIKFRETLVVSAFFINLLSMILVSDTVPEYLIFANLILSIPLMWLIIYQIPIQAPFKVISGLILIITTHLILCNALTNPPPGRIFYWSFLLATVVFTLGIQLIINGLGYKIIRCEPEKKIKR